MPADPDSKAKLREGLAALAAGAEGSAEALAALAKVAAGSGDGARAYELASRAQAVAPDDPGVRSIARRIMAGGVPKWHFGIVRDRERNRLYEEALRRAAGPETRVLDIGAGTGLLALMAARAGAGFVASCEANPAVADAAAEIVRLNGYGERVRVIAKHSSKVDPEADMGGLADVIVSEIVSNDMVTQGALPAMEDAVARLLKPGGRMIPARGSVRVAIAHWDGLHDERMDEVEGFRMSPFNRLEPAPYRLKRGDERLTLRSEPADLFDFDFVSGGPYGARKASLDTAAAGGAANGIAQWIRLELDQQATYENRPEPGASSCWAVLFYPFEAAISAGAPARIHGSHDRASLRVWAET